MCHVTYVNREKYAQFTSRRTMAVLDVFAWLRKYLTVEPVMLLYMTGAFLQFPILQQLVYQKICIQKYNNTNLCSNLSGHKTEEKFVETTASQYLLYLNVANVIPSVLVLFFLGSWTDRFGRKTAMVMPSVGALISATNLIIQSTYIYAALPYLFIGSIVAGLTGGYACVLMTTYTYITDITDNNTRTWRIGILEAMTGLGATIGSALGGVMVDELGFMSVFILYLVLNAVSIVYVVFWLKETVQKNTGSVQEEDDDSAGGKITALVNIENVKRWGRVICKPREKRGRLHIILLLIAFFISIMIFMGWSDIGFLFVKYQLGSKWTSTLYGTFLAVTGVLTFVGLSVFLPLMSRFLGDTRLGQVGMLSRAASNITVAFTTTVWMLYLGSVMGMFSGFGAASLRSLLSKEVELTEKGALFSVVSSIEVMSQLLASVLFNNLYPATLNFFPGLCFLLMAGSLIIPLGILQWLQMDIKRTKSYSTLEEEGNELEGSPDTRPSDDVQVTQQSPEQQVQPDISNEHASV
ncbi:lysosomal proton-coupled steroid conjugate and bile acid symporter SLC46A3-like isoform X2 [Branchiostoma floridae x Branchiostoma belcheri]